MRKSKNRYFYHIFVSSGDAPGALTLMLYGWKENSMLANNLAACAHLTIIVSELERDMSKSGIFHSPLAFDVPVRGFPSEYRHPFGTEKLEWCRYPTVKKIRRYVYSF